MEKYITVSITLKVDEETPIESIGAELDSYIASVPQFRSRIDLTVTDHAEHQPLAVEHGAGRVDFDRINRRHGPRVRRRAGIQPAPGHRGRGGGQVGKGHALRPRRAGEGRCEGDQEGRARGPCQTLRMIFRRHSTQRMPYQSNTKQTAKASEAFRGSSHDAKAVR